MLYQKKISLIIPCKNEQASLYQLLQKVPGFIDEVIVVDNNSNDNTLRVAKKWGAKVIKETKQIGGIGYGFAHQTGLRQATGDYLIFLDGDNTYPVETISDIVRYLKFNDLDFVSCSRLPLSNKEAITVTRKLGINILNLWIMLLYGYYFRDILSGMWVMNKKAARLLEVKSGGWNYSAEVKLAAILNSQIRFSEYHIPYYLRVNGQSKLNDFKTGFEYLSFIFTYRLANNPVKYLTVNLAKGFAGLLSFILFNKHKV